MPYSFSQLKVVHECSYKYKRLYVEYFREPVGPAVLFGQAIHLLFKDILEKSIDSKDAIKLWKFYFESEIENNKEITVIKNYDWWLKRGYPAIQLFYKNKDKLDIKKIIQLEKKLSSTYNNEPFSFVSDLVYKNSNCENVILDYKTGKQKEIDFFQLTFYKELMKLENSKLCLYYIWTGPIFFSNIQYFTKMDKFINEGVSIIKSKKFEKNKGDNCKFCFFKNNECK